MFRKNLPPSGKFYATLALYRLVLLQRNTLIFIRPWSRFCAFQKLDMEPEDTPPGISGHDEAVSDEVRKLRLELATVKAERDDALRKLHKLEEDHGGCEAFKQAMQAGTQMSIAVRISKSWIINTSFSSE